MKRIKLLAPLVLILILAACKSSDKLAFKLNYEKGKKYYYTTISEQSIDQSVMGQNIKTKSTTTTGYIWEVKDIDKDGNYKVTITYDKIESKTESSAGEGVNCDNAQEFLKGVQFDMLVTPKGKVKEIHGIDKMLDKAMSATMPDSMADDKTLSSAKEMLKKQFNDKTMSSMMEQMTNYFPDKDEVEVGDTWENNVDMASIIPMKVSTTYKVVDNTNGIIKLDVDSKISPGSGEGMMGMKMDMKGTQKGTMEIDSKTGIMVKSTVDQTMDGNMSMMGMSFPMKISGKTTVEAKEMK